MYGVIFSFTHAGLIPPYELGPLFDNQKVFNVLVFNILLESVFGQLFQIHATLLFNAMLFIHF